MKAIPTEYRGAVFRSRLEARWAAFFDLIGWRWTYEPVDWDGYIPDFLIHGLRPFYVEVKPYQHPKDFTEFFEGTQIKGVPLDERLLVVGLTPSLALTKHGCHGQTWSPGTWVWHDTEGQHVDAAAWHHWSCQLIVNDSLADYTPRPTGDSWKGLAPVGTPERLERLWNEAHTRTRWTAA